MMDKKLPFRTVRYFEGILYAFVSILTLLVTFATATAQEAWHKKDWVYRGQITVSSSMVYGNQNLTNFPVLVRLPSDGGLAINAKDDGDDILFTDSDGTTKLPHEIEYFNGDTGELVAWVKVPTLSYSTNTTIYMYYGNPSAEDQQDVTGVWSSGYARVYHLHDYQESAGKKYIKDSVSDTYSEAELKGDADTTAAGRIGGAVSFDGSGDWIDTNYGPNYGTSDFTVELWYHEGPFSSGDQYMIGAVKNRPEDKSAVAIYQGRVGGDALKWLLRDVGGDKAKAEHAGTSLMPGTTLRYDVPGQTLTASWMTEDTPVRALAALSIWMATVSPSAHLIRTAHKTAISAARSTRCGSPR